MNYVPIIYDIIAFATIMYNNNNEDEDAYISIYVHLWHDNLPTLYLHIYLNIYREIICWVYTINMGRWIYVAVSICIYIYNNVRYTIYWALHDIVYIVYLHVYTVT